jgi:serine/threonine-protein kinase
MPILTSEERLGSRIAGRYRLEAILGSGGMGVLFRGIDEATERRVAVKMLKPAHATDTGRVARFLRESRIASTLVHPNIATVLDSGTDETGTLYLVMELLEGCSLEQELAQRGVIPFREAVAIVLPIARALSAAHTAGVIHRDLKPSNIFLCRTADDGIVPKLVDFGISKTKADDFETQTGVLIGTPGYMAPEQARDGHCGAFTDVWGLGAVLYRCVIGHPPHGAVSVPELLAKLMTEPVPPVVLDGVSRADSAALDRALQRDPERRYQTMQAFVRALEPTSTPSGNARIGDAPDLFTETLELSQPLPEPAQVSVHIVARRSSRLARGLRAVAAIALAVLVVALLLHGRRATGVNAARVRAALPVAQQVSAPVFTSKAVPAPQSREPEGAAREVLPTNPGEPRAAPSRPAQKRATKKPTDDVDRGARAGSADHPVHDQPDYDRQAGVPVITEW